MIKLYLFDDFNYKVWINEKTAVSLFIRKSLKARVKTKHDFEVQKKSSTCRNIYQIEKGKTRFIVFTNPSVSLVT